MKKATTIRRIIGITALVLWVVVIVSRCFFLFGNRYRLVWQLDNWAFLFAPILTLVYAVMLTIHISRGKHWAVKLSEWLGCTLFVLLCLVEFFIAGVKLNYKVWGDKDYVVYSEYGGFSDPDVYVMYKRCGIVDHHMYTLDFYSYNPPYVLGDDNMGGINSAEYVIYEDLNLIQCDAVVRDNMNEDSTFHATIFYRLDNGHRYNESQNDSLFALIK
jgi:hypothetical protein